jgi:PP-loop superfamily ATP-utilizing enzyme
MPRQKKPEDPFIRKLAESLRIDNVVVDTRTLRVVHRNTTKACFICKEHILKNAGVLAFSLKNPIKHGTRRNDGTQYACLNRKECHNTASLKKLNRTPAKRREDTIAELKESVKL